MPIPYLTLHLLILNQAELAFIHPSICIGIYKMRFAVISILLTTYTLASPQFASKRQDGGPPPNGPSLLGNIMDGIEHENNGTDGQGEAPLDPIAPILDRLQAALHHETSLAASCSH